MSIAVSPSAVFAIENYTGLRAYIAKVLDRTDLEADIPDFIRMCEYSLERRLLHIKREKTATLTISAEEIATPLDFKQAISMHLLTDPIQQLEITSISGLREGFKGTGQPVAYAVKNGVFLFGPAPDGTYSAKLEYLASFDKLSEGVPSNWILRSAADVYVYGALIQAEAYLSNDERIPLWKAGFEEAVKELNEEGVRQRSSASPLRLRSPVCV